MMGRSVKPRPQDRLPRPSARRKHFAFLQKTAKAPVRHTTSAVTASGVIYSIIEFHRSLVSPKELAKPALG